jgi:pimeloyl-ACP methyl ester carboxylesterase
MGTQTVAPITTYFRVCDGVRVRVADSKAGSDVTVLLLSPWPESLWAFRRIWDRVAAAGRVVAIDLPGFGHSDGRPELIAPDTSGAFLARMIDEWGLGAPHVVGPDVGTAAALFLAAKAPERVTSLTIGGGAVRFPIEAGGALKDIIEAPSLDVVRGLDARTNIGHAVEPGAAVADEPEVHEDYVSAYDLGRFAESARFVRHYPEQNPVLRDLLPSITTPAQIVRDVTMSSCRGRTTSTSTTSFPTARSILSTPVTSPGNRQRRNTAAWSPTGSVVGIGAS